MFSIRLQLHFAYNTNMFSKIKIENVVYKMSAIFVRSQYVNTIVCQSLHVSVRNVKEDDDVIKWKHFPRYWPFVPGKFTGHRRGPSENVCSRSGQNWKNSVYKKKKKKRNTFMLMKAWQDSELAWPRMHVPWKTLAIYQTLGQCMAKS